MGSLFVGTVGNERADRLAKQVLNSSIGSYVDALM